MRSRSDQALDTGSSRWSRWLAVFELEDVLLAAWLLVLGHWLGPWLGADRVLPPAGPPSALAWGALAAFAVVFFTRGPDDADLDRALIRRLFSVGPLIFLLSPLALLVNGIRGLARRARSERRGGAPPEPATGWPGPPLPVGVRRTLALPYEIVGEGLFRRMAGSELEHWGAGTFTAEGFVLERPVFALFALATLVVGYGLLVMGPRVVAGAALDWKIWVPRFLLYLAAALGGSRLLLAG
jgi:hypothetical protein